MPSLSLCVHIQLFIETELKFCVAKASTSTRTGTDLLKQSVQSCIVVNANILAG